MNLEELRKQICEIAIEVGQFQVDCILQVSVNDVEEKEKNSLVSYVDKQSEERIIKALLPLIPDAGFITEEDTVENHEKEYTWVIDPLDGTTNYLHRIPHYAVSIALLKEGEVLIGVVHDPSMRECFSASKGNGAYVNDRKITVSHKTDLNTALIVTGFPYTNDYDLKAYTKVLRHWLKNTRGIRRLGSAALDLAYVAAGRLDAYYEATLNKWDIAAGALLVQEAEGIITDLNGGDAYLEKGSVIATSPSLIDQITKPIHKVLNS